MHYVHNKRKYDQILKIDLEIFTGIDHYHLSFFNFHNDIMYFVKQNRSFQIFANQGFNLGSFNLKYSALWA